MPENKLESAKRTHQTDFGSFEDNARFHDTRIETPVGTLICHNDGTFTDITNRLMWMQGPWGMTWGGGSMFRGKPIALNWFAATKLFGKGDTIPYPAGTLPKEGVDLYKLSDNYKEGTCRVIFAKHDDWRLPTAKEFLTVGDYPEDVSQKLFPKMLHFNGLDFWSANDQTKENAWSKHQLFGDLTYESLDGRTKSNFLNILFVRNF